MSGLFTLINAGYKNILEIDTLTIPALQTTCIVGESGSGKTTLLKLLNHLLSCDRGEVRYKGESITAMDPVELRREVVMLSQTPLIFPGSIKDNLLMGLQLGSKPLADSEQMINVLMRMKLDKDLGDNSTELSGGEKQRLAICRIMLMEPDVLLLDEPTSALDDGTGNMVMDMLVSFAREKGKTLVLITHSREVAHKYGDLIITLEKGRVSQTVRREHYAKHSGN